MALNYFVCTLGDARQQRRPFRDVNHLLDTQAHDFPDLPAVGSFRVTSDDHGAALDPSVLTFRDIRHRVIQTAGLLRARHHLRSGEPIGLLCSSGLRFLLVWLGCIRLGCPILLIAPECSASDIAQLCQSCNVSLLLVDGKHEALGNEGATKVPNASLRCVRHPLDDVDLTSLSEADSEAELPAIEVQKTDVAYWHHSSGTSTGVPKPVPQTHHGAVGALPAFDGHDTATFTTTPLYHGGPADLFRAWTSRALTWFFPGDALPITSANIVRCLHSAGKLTGSKDVPPVGYFTSVPFVLESMAAESTSLALLKHMNLVGVGGASLSPHIGDELVGHGVNLVSRYGSAECGFLLSSHREYACDEDWQSLRLSKDVTQLRFEEREDNLFELVVLSDWPQLAKRNRDDGSYSTDDLFARHPSIANAWKYHSPAGARLTLSTGKKFDPTSIEEAMRHVPGVEDALVFGSSKPYPGILVFRDADTKDEDDTRIVQRLMPALEKVNSEGPDQARISRDMVIPMPAEANPIAKSSKGTVLRNKAEAKYESVIEKAYAGINGLELGSTTDENLPATIKHIVQHVLPFKGSLDEDTDLVSYGVDSVAAIQIRKGLSQLLPSDKAALPINIVEDCGSIEGLSQYITKLRHGEDTTVQSDNYEYMSQLVDEYSNFSESTASEPSTLDLSPHNKVIVLTGATGALGATLLSLLAQDPTVSHIYCLVRASSPSHAQSRIETVLHQRRLPAVDLRAFEDASQNLNRDNDTHGLPIVIPLPSTLSSPLLGLDPAIYTHLARSATAIVHLAWSVNFRLPLRTFASHDLPGVRRILELALAAPSSREAPSVLFCSSIASAAAWTSPVPEEILASPRAAPEGSGYACSKWVAEQICERAHANTRLRGRIQIFRVGQLAGHSETGVWNAREAWPLMLSAGKELGVLPDLRGERLYWLPVDRAAEAFRQGLERGGEGLRVFHVLNDNGETTWGDLVGWMGRRIGVEKVAPEEWVRRLEVKAAEDWKHPAVHLLGHWRQALLGDGGGEPPEIDMRKTKEEITVLRDIDAVDEEYFEKLWKWIEGSVGAD